LSRRVDGISFPLQRILAMHTVWRGISSVVTHEQESTELTDKENCRRHEMKT
jgi:hypothetical protein